MSASLDPPFPTSALEEELADELAALLLDKGPLDLRDVLLHLPALRPKLRAASLRLIPLCLLFPSRFSLHVHCDALPSDDPPPPAVTCSLLPPPLPPPSSSPSSAANLRLHLTHRLAAAIASYATRAPGAPGAPAAWLSRAARGAVEASLALAPPHVLRPLRATPSRAAAYLHAAAELFRALCAAPPPPAPPPPLAYRCAAACACASHAAADAPPPLAPQLDACARAAYLSLRAAPPPPRRAKPPPPPAAAAADADDDDDAPPSARLTLAACAAGGELVVLRAACRTAPLFRAEWRAAAAACGAPRLVRLGEGVYLLPPAPAGGEEAAAREALRALLPALGGVRLHVALLAAAEEPKGLAAAAAAAAAAGEGEGGERRRWSLAYEMHFPAAHHAQLPFHRLEVAPRLILELGAAIGGEYEGGGEEGEGGEEEEPPPRQHEERREEGEKEPPRLHEERREGKKKARLHKEEGEEEPPRLHEERREEGEDGEGEEGEEELPPRLHEERREGKKKARLHKEEGEKDPPRLHEERREEGEDGEGEEGEEELPPRLHEESRDGKKKARPLADAAAAAEGEAKARRLAAPRRAARLSLLVLEMKHALLLCDASPPPPPRAAPPPRHPRATPRRLPPPSRLPAWLPPWERRAFSFSAALDPLVAIAAVNLAALEALSALPAAAPPPPLHLLDPCCGSGTILAAALSLGLASVAGADLRHDFAAAAAANLAAAGFPPPAALLAHDATTPFPPSLAPPPASLPLVVSNPPWGHRIGAADDGARIVASVAAQLPAAVMVWLLNAAGYEALAQLPAVRVVRHVRLGTIDVAVARPRHG
ncbi:hypothetical protein AB1Y20_016556 [Prymnesium parvum]|uniref:Ribosomal RNA large subunit methyltransferase K/L-like methyltransferase domain-containing protein n=1 Tax=Prymnesium parvum TaxID=97485 RepID=A0AB34IE47_PRYPA